MSGFSKNSIPTGSIKLWMTGTAPVGWIFLDGSEISRTAYAKLFALWGESFGPGDGENTFKLPDFRGRGVRGVDGSAGIDLDKANRADRGDGTTGDNPGTLQGPMVKGHGHTAQLKGTSADANSQDPTDNLLADPPGAVNIYTTPTANPLVNMAPEAIEVADSSGVDNNMSNISCHFIVKC